VGPTILATKPRLRVLAFVFGLSSGNFAASICSYLNANGTRMEAPQTGVKFTQLPSWPHTHIFPDFGMCGLIGLIRFDGPERGVCAWGFWPKLCCPDWIWVPRTPEVEILASFTLGNRNKL